MLYLFASGGGLFLLDQWSKSLVQLRVQGRCVRWGPVVRIRCLKSVKAFYRREGARAALVMIWLTALALRCSLTSFRNLVPVARSPCLRWAPHLGERREICSM